MHENEEKLYSLLKDLEIEFEKLEHDPFASTKDSGDFYKEKNFGADCKNIFLRTKNGKKHYLITLKKEKQLDIPYLAEYLGENKKMGFASSQRLEKFLNIKPGSVTPFSIIHKESLEVSIIVDKDIFEDDFVHFHPLRNTASLKIKTVDFKKFLDHHDHSTDILDLTFEQKK